MQNWNRAFTNLIRNSRPAYWGNWALNPQIKPGAVGIVDPASGEFRLVAADLLEVRVNDMSVSNTWQLSSEHVSRKEATMKLDGTSVDPETGTTVEAGLEVKWGLEKAGAIASEFALSHEATVDDFGSVILDRIDLLAAKAKSVSMGDGTNIAQGFGVVTGVLWAHSGLNVGSQEDSGSFSIAGSVSGINGMLGKASGKGSYLSTNQEKSIDRHLWPERSGMLAPVPVPIAYSFASFDGRLLIPNWIMPLGAFELVLVNQVGCTYIVDATLTYDTRSGPRTQKTQISGGLTKTFGDISLDATNLKLHLRFIGMIHDDHYELHWPAPLGQWLNGQRHVDMWGVWPAATHVREREAR